MKNEKVEDSLNDNLPDEDANDEQNKGIFTLGFIGNSEFDETLDLQRPKDAKFLIPDQNFGSLLPQNSINTQHLLSNYNRKLLNTSVNLKNRMQSILQKLKLEKYENIFENQEIDLEAFVLLNNEDLIEIGVKHVQDRKILLREIDKLNRK